MKTLMAIAQMTSRTDKDHNLKMCEQLIAQSSEKGAFLLCLPENCVFLGQSPAENLAAAEPLDGKSITKLRQLAERHKIWLSIGGFQEQSTSPGHYYNTHVMLDSLGNIQATYRKIHLFSVTLPDGLQYNEGLLVERGDSMAIVKTPFGTMGLSICYDLRFSELFLAMTQNGAELLLVPAAFTATTGKAHWEILLRARAIECQAYVLAAAQIGNHHDGYRTHGHAMIVDPWGTILSQCGQQQHLALAEIDFSYMNKIRRQMPVVEHRFPQAYSRIQTYSE